jgi:uncharacterized protein (DUF983 family)
MSALFLVNRAADWQDLLVWTPSAILAAGLTIDLMKSSVVGEHSRSPEAAIEPAAVK